MGSVGCPDLPQDSATSVHDIGYTKGSSDLDQLPPGDDNLLSLGKGIEDEQDGRGIVVDDYGGFSPRQSTEDLLDVGISGSPLSLAEVKLQIGIVP